MSNLGIQPDIYYRPFPNEITACSLGDIPTIEFAFGIEKKFLTRHSFPILQSKHCWNSSSSLFLNHLYSLVCMSPHLFIGIFFPFDLSPKKNFLRKSRALSAHILVERQLDIVDIGMVELKCILSVKIPWCTVLNVVANNAENSKTWRFFLHIQCKIF